MAISPYYNQSGSGMGKPSAISPLSKRTGNMVPSMPKMSAQDYFGQVPRWTGNRNQLSMQNPMMSMGNYQSPAWLGQMSGQLANQNPMMGMGGMPRWNQGQLSTQNPMMSMGNYMAPSFRATSNPYMTAYQQGPPQQTIQNLWNPYRNDWNWGQTSPFAGLRFPAY